MRWIHTFCTPGNGVTSQGEHPSVRRALVCVCLRGGSKGHITVCSEDEITPFPSVAEVFTFGLEKVFHDSLEFEAMYLMTLLVGLSHCAHTMLEIRSAAGGCIEEGAGF